MRRKGSALSLADSADGNVCLLQEPRCLCLSTIEASASKELETFKQRVEPLCVAMETVRVLDYCKWFFLETGSDRLQARVSTVVGSRLPTDLTSPGSSDKESSL